MALMTHRATSTTTVNTTCSSIRSDPSSMPPPTYNHLDAAQRSRLVKSTRKLGKVLGATPCILETLPSPSTMTLKSSVTDIASKRRSVPSTPTVTLGEFITSTDPDAGHGRSRKSSVTSTSSGRAENDSSSSYPCLAESTLKHRKASSDTLGPIPVFPDCETGRHKSKWQQPILRIPPMSSNKPLASPGSEFSVGIFPADYKLEPVQQQSDPAMTPLPISPTTSISPASTEMPTTPHFDPVDPIENESPTLPDDVLSYPAFSTFEDLQENESRLRKRRMEKLMRHLGECVPSELVFGTSHRHRDASFSESPVSPVSPTEEVSTASGVMGRMKEAQSRVLRRVSVISGHRRRTIEENDAMGAGCLSDPEPGNASLLQAMLVREKGRIRVARGKECIKEEPLVEDEWTPEAYEDVVKRLRRLK